MPVYILIIEDGVKIDNPIGLNFVRFNRNNPTPAINQLFNINKPAPKTKSNDYETKTNDQTTL